VEEIKKKREFLWSTSKAFDNGSYLYTNIVYYCITSTEEEQISLERFQGQHNVINNCFNALNSDIDRVPSSGVYNYADTVGTCKLRFLPLLGTQLTEDNIIRIVDGSVTSFSGLSSIESYINSSTDYSVPQSGLMNVYCCPLSGNLLGQAELFSNHCVIRNDTVGSTTYPGNEALTNYNYGRTAVHEIGHCLGLPHTFTSNGQCPSVAAFADIPKQKNPNFDAFLVQENGVWTGRLDNRFRDCNSPVYDIPGSNPPYSCMDTSEEDFICENGQYEFFFNYMDYGSDLNAICYSKNQCTAVRQFVISGGVFILFDGPENPPNPDETTIPDVPPTVEENTPLSNDDEGLSALLISLIIVLSIVFVIIIGLTIKFFV
jgi:hypothetical protein